jgi:hypothetical protein
MKSLFMTLAAVLGIAVAASSIPVANANADVVFSGHSSALNSNANQ